MSIDLTVLATLAPVGVIGVCAVGIAGAVAVKANGGLVRVAERLAEALGRQQPAGADVVPAEPAGTHTAAPEPDEFPPHR